MKCLVFKNKKMFYAWLEDKCPKFDMNASLPKSRFSFFDKDGVFYKNGNLIQFINKVNELCGEIILDATKSKAVGAFTYKIFLYEKEEEQVAPVISLSAVESKEEEVPSEDKQKVAEGSETVLEEAVVDIDWPRLEALKNTKDDKMFLDEYAEKTFGIKLKRTKKIEGMLEDFKAALAEK